MINRIRRRAREILARRLGFPEIPVALRRLRTQGLVPDLVVDVGAHHGEFARLALRSWPTCHVLCVEPLPDAADALWRVAADFPDRVAIFHGLAGAGAHVSVPLHVADTASSVLAEHHAAHPTIACRMETLDSMIATLGGGRTPDFIKLDVQGYELEVLTGAAKAMTSAKAILTEVNLIDIHLDVPLLHDLAAWMADRGFVCFDICGLTRRPLDDALWQVDAIFVPIESPLRADRRWSGDIA